MRFIQIVFFVFVVLPICGQSKIVNETPQIEKVAEKKSKQKPLIVAEKTAILDTIQNIITENDSIKIVGNVKYILNQKSAGASYYADKFTGRRTASGKIFNNNAYTCAHRKLPFGTKLRVTSERTNKSVYVVVTDRGPFVRGRHIDLSKRAFFDIAPVALGHMKVTIEIVK